MGVFHLALVSMFVTGSFSTYVKDELIDEDGNFFSIGKKWAVLVAGSEGWYNYRHQADISHAYQILVRNDIPKENIIVMMMDDIANDSWNPTPGKIINKPGGPDVYEGVVIDYKKTDVNSTNFLKIITGDKEAMRNIGSGKVIEGGPFDKIFINFVGHGMTGLLQFPNDFLYADQLYNAFKTMYKNGTYRKMLFYLESCMGGSMFDGILTEDTKILAVTASGPRESSYGWYCLDESKPYYTCLGDQFSVSWMEDLDANVFNETSKKRTIFNDYIHIRRNVTSSNIMFYGNFKIGQEKLSSFIGYKKHDSVANNIPTLKSIRSKAIMSSQSVTESHIQYKLTNVKLTSSMKHKLMNKVHRNNEARLIIDSVLQNIYTVLIKARPDIQNKIGKFDNPNHLQLSMEMFPCYRSILNKISKSCFSLPKNPYSFNRLKIFANLCVVDKNIHQMTEKLIDVSCLNIPKNIKNVY